MSFSRGERFSESNVSETPSPAQYDVNMDFMKGFKLRHKIPRSPRFPEQCSSGRLSRQSSNSSNDDRSSTSSRCSGNTRLHTYYNRTGPRELNWSNSDNTERLHQQVDDSRQLPGTSTSNENEENTGTSHSMGSTSMNIEEENIIEGRTEVNENNNDLDRRTMFEILNSALQRGIVQDSQDENREETPNRYHHESVNNPEDQQTGSVSDSSIDIDLPTSSTSSDDEDEYIERLRSRRIRKPGDLNAVMRSPGLINAREFRVYSTQFSASPSSGRLPLHTGINISVNRTPSLLRPRSTMEGIGLDCNNKEDVMRKIVDLQCMVNRNKRELAQMQELLVDLYRTLDSMQIHV